MSNAILLCSGIGRRMAPIKGCVKGFLPVNGEKSNIHRVLRILEESGISQSVIAIHPDYVTDLAELLMDYVPYSKMDIIYHPVRNYEYGCNNSVTMKSVSDYIGDTYVIECDQYYDEEICKSQIFGKKPEVTTFFTQVRTEEDDWSLVTRECGTVESMLHNNPTHEGYCLSGIIYISQPASRDIIEALNELPSTEYWEDAIDISEVLTMNVKLEKYATEFDEITDLLSNRLMSPRDIARQISENPAHVQSVGGMTNTNFKILYDDILQVLRLPGYGTDVFIDHNREKMVDTYIKEHKPDIGPVSRYYCKNSSVKLTEYLTGYAPICRGEHISLAMKKLHEIHSVELPDKNSELFNKARINLREELMQYESIAGHISLPLYSRVKSHVFRFLIQQDETSCFVHRDPVPLNILINEHDDIKFIDWEYSGILNKYWDVAAFCCEYADEYKCDVTSVIAEVLKSYPEELDIELVYKWMAVVDFIWSAWSLAKIKLGDDVLEYGLHRYQRCLSIVNTCY